MVGTLRFNAGESTKTIYIPVVDDGFSEGQESFNITLSSPGGAIPGVIPVATLAFTDNDATNKTRAPSSTPPSSSASSILRRPPLLTRCGK